MDSRGIKWVTTKKSWQLSNGGLLRGRGDEKEEKLNRNSSHLRMTTSHHSIFSRTLGNIEIHLAFLYIVVGQSNYYNTIMSYSELQNYHITLTIK